jgi:hypothetical protein
MQHSPTPDTADRPHVDHPRPARHRSVPARVWLLAALAAVVLAVVGVLATHGDDAPASADVREISPIVVDGLDPVESDGTTVTTPCFSYRLPTDLALDERSAGCSTAVGFGSDSLTRIRVQAQTGGEDEVVAELHRVMADAEGLTVESVRLHGRDTVRVRNVDGWGVSRTSYLIPLPAGRFTQAGQELGSIWLTSPTGREFDEWTETILDSLEIPGD